MRTVATRDPYAEDLQRLHKRWRERPVGGVVEPESPVRGRSANE